MCTAGKDGCFGGCESYDKGDVVEIRVCMKDGYESD